MLTTNFTIADTADFENAIAAIDAGADAAISTAYTFTLAPASGTTITLSQQLYAINLDSDASLAIDCVGATLDSTNKYNGLFVYAGTVSIDNLTIANAVATGGNGGGRLFIAASGRVTLNNVGFADDSEVGGNATTGDGYSGGGLDGGSARIYVGGGGVGLSASDASKAGIIFGAPGGGKGGGGGLGGDTLSATPGEGIPGNGGKGGHGGFGGAAGSGGGGLGAGGDIFVQQGGHLIIADGTLALGTVTGGTGYLRGGNDSAFGGGCLSRVTRASRSIRPPAPRPPSAASSPTRPDRAACPIRS